LMIQYNSSNLTIQKFTISSQKRGGQFRGVVFRVENQFFFHL
jgi:hypothetical protein